MKSNTSKWKLRKGFRFRPIRAFTRNEDGATVIEFAFLFPFFIFLTLTSLDMIVNYITNRALADTMLHVERAVKTGQSAGMTAEEFRDKYICGQPGISGPPQGNQAPKSYFFDCDKFYIDLREVDEFKEIAGFGMTPDGKLDTSSFVFDPGPIDTINVLRLFYEQPSVLGFNNLLSTFMYDSNKEQLVSNPEKPLKRGSNVIRVSTAFWLSER